MKYFRVTGTKYHVKSTKKAHLSTYSTETIRLYRLYRPSLQQPQRESVNGDVTSR